MSSSLNEAWEWLDRAEQAQEVAGQLTDPSRGKRSWSLQKALIGSPEPPLPRLCSGEGSWRGKTGNETGDFSRAFLSQTASASIGRRSKRMGQPRGILTPEEQARIIELQDLLIKRFADPLLLLRDLVQCRHSAPPRQSIG